MKKVYQKPHFIVVPLKMRHSLLVGSNEEVKSVENMNVKEGSWEE